MSLRIVPPKEAEANLHYRRKVAELGLDNKQARQELWGECCRDVVFFMDTFMWTYNPKENADSPVIPFITYHYQEDAARRINNAIGKNDLLVEKSRDMGASWLCLGVLFWRWLTKDRQSFLLASRKEDYVDKYGDPDCLFWKLDFIYEHLPAWMVPNLVRNKLDFRNESNGSVINGESTNGDLGRGGRRTAIVLDEFAAVENGAQILRATRDATNCRMFVSTPAGSSGAYYDTRIKIAAEAPERLISMHWTLHPIKSKKLYYKDGKPRSPWYDEQCRRAASPQEIAQEIDIDYLASGWQFFDQPTVERLLQEQSRDPLHQGELRFEFTDLEPSWVESHPGRVELWVNLLNSLPPKAEYIIGCDICTGKGGEMSSNSVASVVNKKTGEKVAQFTDSHIDPIGFAKYTIALAKFFHNAFIIWEANGPGGVFGKTLVNMRYPRIYYRKDENSIINKPTSKPGWWSGRDSKRILLSMYRNALLEGRFVNRSRRAISECSQYVHSTNGDIVHSRSEGNNDPSASGESHGDMVIADAVANYVLGVEEKVSTSEPSVPPLGSLAWRRKEAKRKEMLKGAY